MTGPGQAIDPSDARMELGRLLAERDLDLDALTPRQGVGAALDFYREIRARGADVEADGDMLLFQWGTFDWGEGEHFELDLTRQLIVPRDDDEPDVLQLSLTFRFPPTELLRGLGAGNRWCRSPSQVAELRAFIDAAPAFAAVADRADAAVSMWLESVE